VLRDRSTARNENGSYCSNGPSPRPEDNHRAPLEPKSFLEIDVQPNTKALYNNIKEALMEDGVRFIRNGCSLIDSIVTEQQLIERINEI
jgi:hypothetical protein